VYQNRGVFVNTYKENIGVSFLQYMRALQISADFETALFEVFAYLLAFCVIKFQSLCEFRDDS